MTKGKVKSWMATKYFLLVNSVREVNFATKGAVVVAQSTKLSLPIPGVCGSNQAIGKIL